MSQTSTPQPNAMKAADHRRWLANGAKPRETGIKARNKTQDTGTSPSKSPAAQLTPEQLGTKAAFAHELVVKFPKRSTARKAAKRFIELFGQQAFDAELTEFFEFYGVKVEEQVKREFALSSYVDVTAGIRAAWFALRETYAGPKPVAISPGHKSRADQPTVRNVVSAQVPKGTGRKLHQLAKAVEDRKADDAAKARQIAGAPMRKTRKELSTNIVPSDN